MKTDCLRPDCQALKSVDADGYCSCCARVALFELGDIIDGYLVTSVRPGEVCLTKIDPTGPEA